MGPDEFTPDTFSTTHIDLDGDFVTIDPNIFNHHIASPWEGIVASTSAISNYTERLSTVLNLGNVETFYNFLKMWPLYDAEGKVVAIYDTKEHRDAAKNKIENENPSPESPLKMLLKNRRSKIDYDAIS